MREAWPSREEAERMDSEDLALRLLDRLVDTPADRVGDLLDERVFIRRELNEALIAARRTTEPRGVLVARSEEAAMVFPDLARAWAEAWSIVRTEAWVADDPTDPRRVL